MKPEINPKPGRAWPRACLALLFWLATAAPAAGAAEFNYHPLNDAFRLGQAEGKMVMIFFWADWCGYCDLIRNDVFTDPEVHEVFNRNFLAVSVDVKNDPEGLAKKFSARALPTLVFLKPDGDFLGLLPGAVDRETFIKILEHLVEMVGPDLAGDRKPDS